MGLRELMGMLLAPLVFENSKTYAIHSNGRVFFSLCCDFNCFQLNFVEPALREQSGRAGTPRGAWSK
jgi:hypothetical protein